jgi:uncharacterized protein (TIGR02186 family)
MKTCKRHNTDCKIKILFVIVLSFLFLSLTGNASAELTAKANHDHIKIDSFYHGSTVSVRGVSDPGTDLIIKITSPEGHQVLREKGKVAGLLWMNAGELKLDHVPNVYFLHSTKNIDDILGTGEIVRYEIGYQALKNHAEMTSVAGENEKTRWFNEFVKFKEASKLYATSTGKISLTQKDGKQNYYILTQWPYQAAPGNYTVTVYEVKDKKVIDTAEASVLVEQVGIVKSFNGMAKNNGSLYGIISVIAALGAGFGVGMIFKKSGGAH